MGNPESAIQNPKSSSPSGHRGKESDLVTITENSVATHILMVDGGRGHCGKAGQAGNLAGDGVPELADSRAVRQLPALFGTAGRVAKGGEVEEVHTHAGGVYFHAVRLIECPAELWFELSRPPLFSLSPRERVGVRGLPKRTPRPIALDI